MFKGATIFRKLDSFGERRRIQGPHGEQSKMASPLRFLTCAAVFLAALAPRPGGARADDAMESLLPDEAAPRHAMRLDECIAVALEQNFDVRTASEQVEESKSARASVGGELGPKLHLDAYAQQWTEAYNIPFAINMGSPPTNFPVHDAFVWNATVTLSQPITTLWPLIEAYKVRGLGVDIATIHREMARQDAALRAAQAYFRLLQAERVTEVAKASVEQLEAQLRQSNSFHANGVVSLDDVLRAQLAVANAQQRLIQSRARVALGRSELAVALGMSPDAPIDAAPLPEGDAAAAPAVDFADAEKAAEGQRVELTEIDKRLVQSKREITVAWAKLAPQVSAVASYVHNEGSLFSQLNSGYVGAVASWDVWDWGTTTSGISAAKARLHETEIARAKIDDQIRLEVRTAFLGVRTAAEAMAVARAAVAEAEEDFTLVRKRYEANTATSFNVIDAEGQLTQARGQLETARYDALIARAALRRAVGDPADRLARE
jgi:outer membrane protein TolC